MELEIGEKIKNLRKSSKITLEELAAKTEFSVGFLSNVENDKTSPSIQQLHKICEAMGLTLNDLLVLPKPVADAKVVRKDDRQKLFSQDDGSLVYESITQGDTKIKGSCMTISSDVFYPFVPHDHDELGIIVSGSMEMKLDNKSFFLYPGDTIYIPSGTMHSAKKTSKESCVSYWLKKAD